MPNFDPLPDARNVQVRAVNLALLNDRSGAKVGLEPEGISTEPDVRAVRAGSTAGLKAGSPIACATWHAATEGCYDPDPLLTDLLSHG